ncbi:Sulfotransferase domain containing protein [Parasponia andersonii]|uniref:Sulfotransferase n=1 Tax=Parasponia andersonii TaxID=3476 RepID=A0A2P5E2L4_PARAD|nr:Sulfotransferase domain containing protein [Parasponia andersonii]
MSTMSKDNIEYDQRSPPSSDSNLPKYLQQNDVVEEFKDLVFSLPIEKGWVASYVHQYQGFWHTTRQIQGVLSCQKHFKSLDNDILLVSTPKSGTTWLKAIIFSLVNRSTFPDTNHNHPLLTTNPHVLVPFLELDLYIDTNHVPDLSAISKASFDRPRLFSTHLPYVSLPESVKTSACKIVYLCRNPKDIFVSLWHFTNRLRPESWGQNSMEESFDKFCNGVSLYGPFWDHLLGYWKVSSETERPEKVLFLNYDEMRKEPFYHVKKLAEFVEFPFSVEEEANGDVARILELCSFDNLSNLEVNKSGKLWSGEENKAFFRRGEVGDWMNHLTPEMAEKLDSLVEQKLHGSGLKF